MRKSEEKEAKTMIAKKSIILYVKLMLEIESSKENPMTATAISAVLASFGLNCDRKTVGRNIDYLIEFGYPIVKVPGKGCYMDGELDTGKVLKNLANKIKNNEGDFR